MAQITYLDVNNSSASQMKPPHFTKSEPLLRCLQQPTTCHYPEPDNSSPFLHPTLKDVFWPYLPIYACAFQMGSFLQISPQSLFWNFSILYEKCVSTCSGQQYGGDGLKSGGCVSHSTQLGSNTSKPKSVGHSMVAHCTPLSVHAQYASQPS